MGRPGQPVCRLRRNRRHGHRHQRRCRYGAPASRRDHGRSERTRHSASRGQPAACGPERQPCRSGTGTAGLPKRRGVERTRKKMKETQEVTLEKLGEVIELGADKAVVAALSETVKNIDDTIKSLGAAARERLAAASEHDKQYNALRDAQTTFVAIARPAMTDAQA